MFKKYEKRRTKGKQKILVYGISGMVGSRIHDLLKSKFHIIGPSHSVLDLTNEKFVRKNIKDSNPDQIIYAAGITKVDYAETHPKEAFKLNAEVLRYICTAANDLNIPVHYISTEAVFNGAKTRPYKETDLPNPISIYGKSKLEGENIVLSSSSKNSVLRTITVYSATFSYRMDFARTALEALKNRTRFEGIIDQFINPTFVDDLVMAIAGILENKARGIYHVSAVDCTTNYGFVEKIADHFGYKKNLISKISLKEFSKDKVAPRIKYGCLDTYKFRKEIDGDILHTIDESLNSFKNILEERGTH